MIKRPFFGLQKPKLISLISESQNQEHIIEIPLPKRVTLFVNDVHDIHDDLMIKIGDQVKTGQKLKLDEGDKTYAISSVTGTVAGISQQKGYLGQVFTAISIDTAQEDLWDEEFKAAGQKPNSESATKFLDCLPGDPNFLSLLDPGKSLDTLIIAGLDHDLLVTTNQFIVKTKSESLKLGIEYMREITGAAKTIFVVPPDLVSDAEKAGVKVEVIEPAYPNTLPQMIAKNVLGKVVPAGKRCEDVGIGFINAETVVALANAFTEGHMPVTKTVTVIQKDYTPVHVHARIGTHVGEILNALGIETQHGDRLVLGGPMTGHAIHSEDTPVLHDTDAVMVQDKSQIELNSEIHCINCGECVRVCPANIPVNMLIRLLENGLYEDAVRDYDLLCCIECGLCSYVCPARIPVFQYVMLGKSEFARIESMEESNA
jgi:electron transport complex protein RnfC